MAKEQRIVNKRKIVQAQLPLRKINYLILLAGLLTILLGYVALSQEPYDSFISLWVAPILLVLGYCVLIPLGILFRTRQESTQQ